ncbi:MAG: hypothetical protein AB8B59_07865 [Maribacter sp.]
MKKLILKESRVTKLIKFGAPKIFIENIVGKKGYDLGLMAYMYFNPTNLFGRIVIINTDTDFDEGVGTTS